MIEDKTIELMVSAARWTVCSSVRPAPGGPAHISVRPRPFPAVSAPTSFPPPRAAFPGLGPGAVPSDPSRSQAGGGPAPRLSSLPQPCLGAHLSIDPRSLMLWPYSHSL